MGINYENIEKYLNNELTNQELEDFNLQIKNDTNFKEEVELYIEINKSLNNKYSNLKAENDLKNTLSQISEKHFVKNSSTSENKTIPMKSYFLKISSIAAILVIGFFLLKPQTSLYNQFAEHSALEIQVKGSNEEDLLKASKFFNHKKFESAIPLFESYLRQHPEDSEIQISLGISLLEENNIEDAQLVFEHVYNQNNIFKNKALWYLALSSLKNKDTKQVKDYLNKISKESSYFKKSLKLLKKL